MHFLKEVFVAVFLLRIAVCSIPEKDIKPNVFILTDISNEPDDAESLVRLLLYSNELLIKGIVATTSYWLNDTTHEEDIYPIIDAYDQIHSNLLLHSSAYPSADYLRSIVSKGHPIYGLDAFNESSISQGARRLIQAVDQLSAEHTLFILVWGGAGVLAELLNYINNRSKEEVDFFVLKLFVYSISDQDDAGPWIRTNFPQIRYIASIHGFNQYGLSTWVGISGEGYNPFDFGGPDSSLVSKSWLEENIRSVGPLGSVYPEPIFNMEGDTPSTLFVLPNGLNAPENPNYGGWGGRYSLVDISGRSQHYADTTDYVVGLDNKTHVSNKATIWRWRDAYQNDFAARMQWTVKNFNETQHSPIAVVNGSTSVKPFKISAKVNEQIVLDASSSYDLNGLGLRYKWFHYRDISLTQGNILEVPEIIINKKNEEGSIISLQVPSYEKACLDIFNRKLSRCKEYHIILEITSHGEIPLKSYRRFVIDIDAGCHKEQFKEQKSQNFFGLSDEL